MEYNIKVGDIFKNQWTTTNVYKDHTIHVTKVTAKYITYDFFDPDGTLVKSNIRSWVYNNEYSMEVIYTITPHRPKLFILKYHNLHNI
tara:strand:- start:1093 stop:1356 length:264 start_codon:yes stop_codon:yes gene_type:complete